MSPGGAARWSSLAAAVAGLLGGIATKDQDPRLSAAIFSVAWVFTGVWLVLLIRQGGDDGR